MGKKGRGSAKRSLDGFELKMLNEALRMDRKRQPRYIE